MNREQRRLDYLARAEEAEKEAARSKEPEAKAQWLKIAESYRELANSLR